MKDEEVKRTDQKFVEAVTKWRETPPKHNAIICAANRNPETGTVIKGHRHFDETMVYKAGLTGETPTKFQEQGFIDMYGNFVDRRTALKIVLDNGQFFDPKRNVCKEKLYSEGIY